MLLLELDDRDPKPVYRQIIDGVRRKIESGVLRAGDKLPSTRRLAEDLSLHRSTVALSYQELWALGYLDLRPRSSPRVRERVRIAGANGGGDEALIDWGRASAPAAGLAYQAYLQAERETDLSYGSSPVDFRSLDMDRRLFPLESFRRAMSRALLKNGASLLGYPSDRAGFPPLRETLARRLRSHGISVTAPEIFLTNGAQQALDMVLRLVAAPGRAVAIESPTYRQIIPLIRLHGLKALEVPVRDDGMDLSVLAAALRSKKLALVYTMPNFQNPTGVTTSQAHRERLLGLCETHRIPILEDGFEEEMKYFGRVVLPIKSMDRHRLVIYCGTLSKVLFPGVRIGWIAADRECVERLKAIRLFSELATSAVPQAAVHEFFESGAYDRHVSRMHRVFRKRMQTALRTLSRELDPEWAEWREPKGGYLIWIRMKPVPGRAVDWEGLLAGLGVKVSPGRPFFFSRTPASHLRLSISTVNEDEIVEGVGRLAEAARRAHAGRTS
jgi:DNA-binding transcriptional MocR family regulator